MITSTDMQALAAIARYYVLTREMVQAICFGDHASGRSTRKHLSRLRQAGYIVKHRMPVALPGTNGAAPVYYPTKGGAEALASYFDDPAYLATNTRHPRADRLAHWIAINETRLTIERAVAAQQDVALERWITEWQVVNTEAHEKDRYYLHVQFSERPPLSCSPDAAFLLSAQGYRKVFYVERDLGTSSPRQIAASKAKGYAELANQQYHWKHFSEATVSLFTVLFITTNSFRRDATAKELTKQARPELWRFASTKDLTPETFLHAPVFRPCEGEPVPLVRTQAAPVKAEQPVTQAPGQLDSVEDHSIAARHSG